MKQLLSINGYNVFLQYAETEQAKTHIYLHAGEKEAEDIYVRLLAHVKHCRVQTEPFALISISGIDWNRDLSPWPAEKAFSGGEAFSGGTDEYLITLTEVIIPAVETALSGAPETRMIAGYSMAGLFALYSVYKSSAFDKIACMSGSLWYDGFTEYTATHKPLRTPVAVYFSLGSKEAETKNARLATVDACTREVERQLRDAEIAVLFVENEGGHFYNIQKRITDGIWTLIWENGSCRLDSLDQLHDAIEMGLDIEFFLFHIRYNISWRNHRPFICFCPDGNAIFCEDTEAMLDFRIDGVLLRDLWRQIEIYSM